MPTRRAGKVAQPPIAATPVQLTSVDLGTPKARSIARRLAAQATSVRWAPVPSVFVGQPSALVRVGGVVVTLPGDWEVTVDRSSNGAETVYALDTAGSLHLVAVRDDGEPRELADVPLHVLDALRVHYFPGAGS